MICGSVQAAWIAHPLAPLSAFGTFVATASLSLNYKYHCFDSPMEEAQTRSQTHSHLLLLYHTVHFVLLCAVEVFEPARPSRFFPLVPRRSSYLA